MENTKGSKTARKSPRGGEAIGAYADAQSPPIRAVCAALRSLIDAAVPGAESKVWHGSPVWFIDDNPVVGYSAGAGGVNLLFWNGRAFDEPGLKPVGKYGAARATFAAAEDIDGATVRRWLKKARSDVFDSRAFFKKMREARETERQPGGASKRARPGARRAAPAPSPAGDRRGGRGH